MIVLRKLTLYAAVSSIYWDGEMKVGPFAEKNKINAIARACARARKELGTSARLAYDQANLSEFSAPRWYEVPAPSPKPSPPPSQKQLALG